MFIRPFRIEEHSCAGLAAFLPCPSLPLPGPDTCWVRAQGRGLPTSLHIVSNAIIPLSHLADSAPQYNVSATDQATKKFVASASSGLAAAS